MSAWRIKHLKQNKTPACTHAQLAQVEGAHDGRGVVTLAVDALDGRQHILLDGRDVRRSSLCVLFDAAGQLQQEKSDPSSAKMPNSWAAARVFLVVARMVLAPRARSLWPALGCTEAARGISGEKCPPTRAFSSFFKS